MADIMLQHSLGNAQVDEVVQKIICVYEEAFPGEIAAYYVEGSYVDRTQLATSDIDLVIVFRQPFTHPQIRAAAEQAWDFLNGTF